MPELVKPENDKQLIELIQYGLAENKRFSIAGTNTRAGFGYKPELDIRVSMSAFTGIIDYEPAELVMRARAGTPLAEIRQLLSDQNQHLAFEPAYLGGLYDTEAGAGTIAGVFMANNSGSRRFQAGAARDHLLGFKAVNGRGELYKSGGNVIKNVTGYDLSKVLSGSWGTLSVLSELSFKVLPKPSFSTSVVISGLSINSGLQLLSQLARSPLQASGLAFLPGTVVPGSTSLQDKITSTCLIRFEGSRTSVDARIQDLNNILSNEPQITKIVDEESVEIWRNVNNVSTLRALPVVMKLSIPPASAATLSEQLISIEQCQWHADAAGAWFWIGLPVVDAVNNIQRLREHVANHGGSAVLYKAPDEIKKQAGLFSPMEPALAALQQRVKTSFDPENILNPGRLASKA